MWNKDQMKGKADELKGRVKGAAGDLTDNESLKDEGAADELKGSVREQLGKGRKRIGEALDDLGDRIKR